MAKTKSERLYDEGQAKEKIKSFSEAREIYKRCAFLPAKLALANLYFNNHGKPTDDKEYTPEEIFSEIVREIKDYFNNSKSPVKSGIYKKYEIAKFIKKLKDKETLSVGIEADYYYILAKLQQT